MEPNFERKNEIDYIIDSVVKRGFDENNIDCNDYFLLLGRKEFKELISVEIYEYYFLGDRHEFDLQLIREVVEATADFFADPNTLLAIKNGIIETIPSAILIGITGYIGKRMQKKSKEKNEESYWAKIEANTRKIDAEFRHHDYVLADEIDKIFDASKEEIQPLLKLCGCRCYCDKKRSLWIKPGVSEHATREILQKHRFRVR